MLDTEGCWIRANHVIADGGDPAGRADEGPRRVELEATPEETEHPRIRRLLDLGLAELVDPSEVAVAIAVDLRESAQDETDPLKTLRSVLRGPVAH
jgi:hypothetical protein